MKRKNIATRFSNLAPVRKLSLLVSRMPKPLRWLSGGSALSLIVWSVIATVLTTTSLSGLTPDVAQAAGVYTSLSTDAYGNTHLAADSVTASSTYNLDEDDSLEDIQQQLGVDPNWRNGVVRGSGALRFSSSASPSSRISSMNANYTPTMTMEGWVRITARPSVVARFFGGSSPNNYSVAMGPSGDMGPYAQNGSGTYFGCGTVTGTLILPVNTTFHFAIVFIGGSTTTAVTWYVNGTLLGSCTLGYVLPASNVTANGIGSLSGGSAALDGTIDEVRYSDIARYTSNFTPQRRFTEDANTTGLWHFDEGSGQTVFDSSGNGYNGTLGSNSSVEASDPTRVDGAQAINQGFRGCSPDDTNDASCSTGGRMGAGNLTLGVNSSTTDDKQYEVQMAPSTGARVSSSVYGTSPHNSSQTIGTSDFTIEAWFRTGGTSNSGIIAKGDSFAVGNWDLRVISTGASQCVFGVTIGTCAGGGLYFSATNSLVIADNLDLRDNSWHHVAVTRSGTTYRLFVDGKLRQSGTATQTNLNTTDKLCLLAVVNTGSCGAPGDVNSLDEVRLSNTARYTSDFIPARRHKADANTMALYHLDEASGTTAYDASSNGNTMTFTATPTWTTGVTRTNPLEGDPLYYQYRDVGGTWSAALPSPATSTQLGSTGIFLRFNPAGQYSAYDRFLINSWAVEAPTTGAVPRGTRRSFPSRAHIVVSPSGIDIIDSATNTLWMRFNQSDTNYLLGASTSYVLSEATMRNGILYVSRQLTGGTTASFLRVHFGMDTAQLMQSDACYSINLPIAHRDGTNGYTAGGCDYEVIPASMRSVATMVSGGVQYVAFAGADGVYLYSESTRQYNRYVKTSGDDYTKAILTSDGKLYAANGTAGGVDVWTNVTSDTADQAGADYSYTTSSTPALRSNTVNSLSATTATSSAQTGSNTLAIGHDLGVDTIDEHSTQASSGIRYYVREGNAGTSGYSQKQFGGGIFTKLIGTNSVVRASMSSYSNSTVTIEMLYNPTAITPPAASHRILYSNGGSCVGNNIEIVLLGGNTPNICTQSSNATAVSALPTANVWYHLVFQITAGVPSIYVNGIRQTLVSTPTYTSGTVSATANAYIGARTTEPHAFCSQCAVAYFDEFRISNTARYTSNFTPSKVPFTADANTVALYHFNERDGQTIYDSSANANNGTLGASSSVSTDDPLRVIPAISGASDKVTAVGLTKSGGTARGMQFDGVNDYISVPAPTTATGSVTMAAWVNLSSNSLSGAFLKIGGSWGYGLGVGGSTIGSTDPGNNLIGLYENIRWINSGNSIGTGFHHVAMAINGSGTATLYIDGALVNTSSGTPPNAPNSGMSIGGYTLSGFNRWFSGGVSSVRVYSALLSATDIANLYNAERMGRTFDGYAGNLVGHWKLDERSGQTITDSSGTGNNGTFGATSSVATDDPTPTIAGPSLIQSPTLWVATNGAGANDGAVTKIIQPEDRQDVVYTTTNSLLPDLDITSFSMTSAGLAFIGTENGGWSTGAGGAPELTNGVSTGATRIKGGTIRITGQTRISR